MIAARQDPALGVEWLTGFTHARLHNDLQWHLSDCPDAYAELHRGCGKTAQATARVAWEIGNNPALRVKYVQQTDVEAAKSVGVIAALIESERFRLLFPHVKPSKADWSKTSLRVVDDRVSTTFARDATVEAKGIFGRAGGRFDLLVCDDVCDMRNAVQQAALRAQVKEAYANTWYPMRDLAAPKPPRVWKFGTPYHVEDITADWRKVHAADGSLFRKPVVDFVSPWAEVFTADELRRIREVQGPTPYARAYELVPVSSDMLVFPKAWLDEALYVERGPQHVVGKFIASIDWAYTDAKTTKKADPDWSVCGVAWVSSARHIFVVDCIRERLPFPEFARRAAAMLERWGVEIATAEANGPQAGIVDSFREIAPCPVVKADRVTDKLVRAIGKQAFIEQGRFHLPRREDSPTVLPWAEPIYDELTVFPASEHDDTVDMAIDLIDLGQRQEFKTRRVEKIPAKFGALHRIFGN